VQRFVGNVAVAWSAEDRLGVLQWCHGGAGWQRPGDGMPAVLW
jgi:hypothetical protein